MYDEAVRGWEVMEGLSGPSLRDAVLQSHWALQPVAAVGAAAVAPRPDDSHASTRWVGLRRALAGEATPGGHRAALRLADLTALLLDGDGGVVEQQPLDGRTLDDALSWFAGVLEKHEGLQASLSLPSYDMPHHAAASGAALLASSALPELGRWYANAARFLEEVRSAHSSASEVRCWPHHFDIATLITLDDGQDPERARSIGVGLSPGDESIGEPYFYANPWPPPQTDSLPALDGPGRWHAEGWVGAVLPASRVLCAPVREQARQVATHLDGALAACRRVLGAGDAV